MKTGRILLAVIVALGVSCATVLADGMIVPVRPDLRVRGHWAVRYHHVDITVRDQVASVTIDQEFINTGRGMIEVEYLFPVPPEAAITSMTMIVNGKEFAAKLLKADEARRIYESIVRKKKDPALLEYAGFGLYRTKAFPLEPGKPCKVVVTYNDVCKKDNDLVEVWYPLNTEKFSAKPIDDVRVTVDVKEKADITAIYSPTHDLDVDRKGSRQVIATYHEKNVLPATDFQVFYKAANEDIGATLLTYQPGSGEDGYFMMLISPNPRSGSDKIVPKDIVIVLDRSGSMSGEKIRQAKEAVRFILRNLNEYDRFNLIAYSDTVESFFEQLVPGGIDKPGRQNEALERLDRIQASGGTNIHEALQKAMSFWPIAGRSDSRPKYVIFLTDGLPTVGKKDEKTILADTKAANTAGVRLFAFGVGYDVNVRLLDKLSGENNGRSDYVRPKENVETRVSSLYAKIKNPVMTDLKVRIHGLGIKDTYPRELGDLFEGDQIVMVGRYIEKDFAKPPTLQLVITGSYEGRERAFEYPVTANTPGRRGYEFVEKLWAVRRIGYLLNEIALNGKNKELIDEIVRLSTKHGIMTPYTSFLADETTNLASPVQMRERAEENIARDFRFASGGAAQKGAMNRQALSYATRAPEAKAVGQPVSSLGVKKMESYEDEEIETVSNVRQVGNQALYRRGRAWVASNAADVDINKQAHEIIEVDRFSKEYFELVRANTTAENQVLASQQPDEDLLIRLRGQVYRIR